MLRRPWLTRNEITKLLIADENSKKITRAVSEEPPSDNMAGINGRKGEHTLPSVPSCPIEASPTREPYAAWPNPAIARALEQSPGWARHCRPCPEEAHRARSPCRSTSIFQLALRKIPEARFHLPSVHFPAEEQEHCKASTQKYNLAS